MNCLTLKISLGVELNLSRSNSTCYTSSHLEHGGAYYSTFSTSKGIGNRVRRLQLSPWLPACGYVRRLCFMARGLCTLNTIVFEFGCRGVPKTLKRCTCVRHVSFSRNSSAAPAKRESYAAMLRRSRVCMRMTALVLSVDTRQVFRVRRYFLCAIKPQ